MGTGSIYSLICSDKVWLEGAALEQLQRTASMPYIKLSVGMPHLHPGKGHPVGVAFTSKGAFYPYIIGNDIGCGMGFWQTDLTAHKVKLSRMVNSWKRD